MRTMNSCHDAHGQQHARRHSAGTQHTDPERAATRITQTKKELPKPPAPPPLTCGASRARPRRPPCSRTMRRKSADAKHRSEVVLEHSHRSGGRKREDRSIAALLVAAQSTALPGRVPRQLANIVVSVCQINLMSAPGRRGECDGAGRGRPRPSSRTARPQSEQQSWTDGGGAEERRRTFSPKTTIREARSGSLSRDGTRHFGVRVFVD